MSRICVKNLPKYVAEDRLREFFSQKGEITDTKLMRTKDGKSRQFAFIGFRTDQEAQEAIKYFNKSYLDTARIACEIARKVGDPEIPRPWSRHSLSKKDKATETGKGISGEVSTLGSLKPKGEGTSPEEKSDPQLQEFLQVMQPRAKSKLWANDSVVAPVSTTSNDIHAQKKQVGGRRSIPTDTDTEAEKRNYMSKEIKSAAKDSPNFPHAEAVSDVDYFKSRVKQDWSESESSDDDDSGELKQKKDHFSNGSSSESDDKMVDSAQEHSNMKLDGLVDGVDDEHPLIDTTEKPGLGILSSNSKNDKEENLVSGRLFVRNLPYSATEEELEELFSKFGRVSEVHVVVDKDTRRSKGIAYIQYQLSESSARALEELDNSSFQGRLLHVLPAMQKSNPDKQDDSMIQSANTFKEKREEQRRASEASGDTRAWNTLYMRADTVVENIARKFGISKSDFLDREADDLAVRVALGEAQVIAETKKALSEAGVNVAALEEYAAGRKDAVKRSNHVLLVKNLPYGSSGSELTKMFGDYGSLEKVVLPPTKTMALVIFLELSEARAAFKGLAYKRYKDAPLYLEWAPSNILSPASMSGSNDNGAAIIVEQDAKRVLLEKQLGLSEVDADSDKARTLYVKNISFKTTDETLKSHFSGKMKEGKILSAKIKKHVKNGKLLSEGYGFVEFDSPETAANICEDLQGTVLDGHALILRPSQVKEQKQQLSTKRESDKSSTKLLIRNVAFEATEKDLRKLFGAFGKIKSLRLPNKFGNHRGFAFVEFVTKAEAQNAMKSLFDTHLYGRHLVIERAKEGESLEDLRSRTAAQFTEESHGFQNQTKLSRKRKHTSIVEDGRIQFEDMEDGYC